MFVLLFFFVGVEPTSKHESQSFYELPVQTLRHAFEKVRHDNRYAAERKQNKLK